MTLATPTGGHGLHQTEARAAFVGHDAGHVLGRRRRRRRRRRGQRRRRVGVGRRRLDVVVVVVVDGSVGRVPLAVRGRQRHDRLAAGPSGTLRSLLFHEGENDFMERR